MQAWDDVADTIRRIPEFRLKHTIGRSYSNRLNKLISDFKREEQSSKRASGIAEDYDERRQLLTEIETLLADLKQFKEEGEADVENAEKQKTQDGPRCRDMAVRRLSPKSNMSSAADVDTPTAPTVPTKHRRTHTQLIEVLGTVSENLNNRAEHMIGLFQKMADNHIIVREERKLERELESKKLDVLLAAVMKK